MAVLIKSLPASWTRLLLVILLVIGGLVDVEASDIGASGVGEHTQIEFETSAKVKVCEGLVDYTKCIGTDQVLVFNLSDYIAHVIATEADIPDKVPYNVLNTTASLSNTSRHKQGINAVSIGSLFIGVGEVKGAASAFRATRRILASSPLELRRLAVRLANDVAERVLRRGPPISPAAKQKLIQDLSTSKTLRTWFDATGETGVRAWEKLVRFPNLSGNTVWLNRVSKWIDDGLVLVDDGVRVVIRKNGNEVGRIADDVLQVKYAGLGGDVVCHSSKTTTAIGRWSGGTEDLWNSGLAKQVDDAVGNPSGMNILGTVDNTPPPAQVWSGQNKPWLDAAINRDDVIRVVSEPIDIDNVFFIKDNIPTSAFSSPQNLSSYLTSLSETSVEVSQLGFYGREIRHLF